ncbi:MAG TPA: MFS transporter [Pseudonocardiaceae bacterium]
MTTTAAVPPVAKETLWGGRYRATTGGLVLLVTLVAFEAMSVGTAMPTMVADLGGQALYSWPFTAFLAASVVGTVLSGRVADTRGPRLPLLAGPVFFAAGLLVAGFAPTMELLLAGRVLQGLGGGIQIVALYALVGLVYPESTRPAVFGVISAAWVLPALVGPVVAGLLTEHASWRWVFLGLAPFVALGIGLLVPMLRRLPESEPTPLVRRWLIAAAVAAAAGLSALTWAAQHPSLVTALLAAGGLLVLAPALRTLLPAGTLRAARGLPSVVLARGLLTGSFFAVEAYLPLTLTAVHGTSPALAGLPLTVGALGWSGAAAWQGRHPDIARHRLMRAGFLIIAAGLAGTTVGAFAAAPFWLVLPFWIAAGAGMGLAMPSVSVRLLELSPASDRGFNSAAMQIWDMLLSAACIGFGGVLLLTVASAAAPAPAVITLNVLMAGLALLGAVLAARTAGPPPGD